ASFANLVYASAWIKCRYPDVFACALLNSQPMGFYAPAQIVRDAQEHGVEIRPVDVNFSCWDCTLEQTGEAPLLIPPPGRGRSVADAGAEGDGRRRPGGGQTQGAKTDPHPARKSAPTSPFQEEVAQVALPNATILSEMGRAGSGLDPESVS